MWHGWHSYHYHEHAHHGQPPVEYKPTWWHPTFASRIAQAPAAPCKPYQLDAGRQVDEPTPFRQSHLSGMGDSDCAERARRIARLSLPLVSCLSLHMHVAEANYHTQYPPVLVLNVLDLDRNGSWKEVRDTICISA
ncbi:hypothetical protein C8Q74DRAFT_570304 [Fomes fomentarius]|nr:hypothetical protein C8Q74DRAFT_570304 [Fomes fomentarius]